MLFDLKLWASTLQIKEQRMGLYYNLEWFR